MNTNIHLKQTPTLN